MDKSAMEKVQDLLKKVLKAIEMCEQKLLKNSEASALKEEVKDFYNSISLEEKESLLGRKLYRLMQSGSWIWTMIPKAGSGGFIGINKAVWLTELKDILGDFAGKEKKIKRRLETDNFWLQSNIQNGDEHLMLGEKHSSEKSHIIIDQETGEQRIDPKDVTPHKSVSKIETTLTRKSGEEIEITESSMRFIRRAPNVSIYPSDKEKYFLLEIYNSGNEDIKDILVEVVWRDEKGEQRRKIEGFIGEKENPIFARPHRLNVLRKGETKFATGVPRVSLDKKIKVKFSGVGVLSEKEVCEDFEIKIPTN